MVRQQKIRQRRVRQNRSLLGSSSQLSAKKWQMSWHKQADWWQTFQCRANRPHFNQAPELGAHNLDFFSVGTTLKKCISSARTSPKILVKTRSEPDCTLLRFKFYYKSTVYVEKWRSVMFGFGFRRQALLHVFWGFYDWKWNRISIESGWFQNQTYTAACFTPQI